VPGKIDHSTVTFGIRGTRPELRFDITDIQGGTERMTVLYTRPKPENFANATSVEAVGKFRDGEFHAHTLLVKCPSKYQSKERP
jgi:cytochrome c-type biogenesis protein CcmE